MIMIRKVNNKKMGRKNGFQVRGKFVINKQKKNKTLLRTHLRPCYGSIKKPITPSYMITLS